MTHPALAARPFPRDAQRIISNNVRAGLYLRAWTQHDLAMFTGISRSRLSRLLNGSTPWRLRDMWMIAKVFGIDQAELLIPAASEGAA